MATKCPCCGTVMAKHHAADPETNKVVIIFQCPAAIRVWIEGKRPGFFTEGFHQVPGFDQNPHATFKDNGFYTEAELAGRVPIEGMVASA